VACHDKPIKGGGEEGEEEEEAEAEEEEEEEGMRCSDKALNKESTNKNGNNNANISSD
jgi:hypothetical protein